MNLQEKIKITITCTREVAMEVESAIVNYTERDPGEMSQEEWERDVDVMAGVDKVGAIFGRAPYKNKKRNG